MKNEIRLCYLLTFISSLVMPLLFPLGEVTSLHGAAGKGHREMVEILLAHKADVHSLTEV